MKGLVSNMFNVEEIRKDFPILTLEVHGKPLVYLDNAATTLKPRLVIEAMEKYYLQECANVHRGVHFLSEQATASFEEARRKIKDFINKKRLKRGTHFLHDYCG